MSGTPPTPPSQPPSSRPPAPPQQHHRPPQAQHPRPAPGPKTPALSVTLEQSTERSLKAVLEAGRLAPTAHNTQPQAFVVVRDPVRRGELVRRASEDRMSGALHWPMPWFAEATALIAVLFDPQRVEPGSIGPRNALLSLGSVLESMRIAADAAGAAWTEWRPSEKAEADLRRALSVPERFQIHCVAGLVPERPSFPPPPSLSTPFAETFGHADPLLRLGPIAKTDAVPAEVLGRRRTARGHFVSAPLSADVVRGLVADTARAGRAPGIAAPRLVYVQSPAEIGKVADVMFDVAAALYRDPEYNRAVGNWELLDEKEWQQRGEGMLIEGKGVTKLLKAQSKGLWGRLTSALGGSGTDELVKEAMSELLREAPLVIAWAIEPASSPRARTAAIVDAGASTMRTLYDAERLGLGAQACSILLDVPPGARPEESGEARVKQLLAIPASNEVVAIARVGKLDTEDTPPSITWRGEIRRAVGEVVFAETYSGS